MGASLWSASNISKKASRAVILDSGNFVMLSDGNNSDIVWQSFDNPVDTLLPGMRFGGQQKIVCWKNSFDPAPGLFSLHVDPSGVKQFVLTWNNSVHYWASGTWDGSSFTQTSELKDKRYYNNTVENNLYDTYTPLNIMTNISRSVLDRSGVFQQVSLLGSIWHMLWSQPRDQCAVYGLCGAYGSCNTNNVQFCSCVEGFTPKNNRAWDSGESWSSGCVRQSPLNCDPKIGSTDGFLETSVTFPVVDSSSSYPASTKKDCQKACLLKCSCTAFAFNPPSGPCQIWSGDLLNMRNSLQSESNSNVFIRVAASALPKTEKLSSFKLITTIVVGALAVAFGIFSILMWRRHWQRCKEAKVCGNASYTNFERTIMQNST